MREWSRPGRSAFFERVVEEARIVVRVGSAADAGLHLLIVLEAAVRIVAVPEDGGEGGEFELRRPEERRPVELTWLPDSGFRILAGRA